MRRSKRYFSLVIAVVFLVIIMMVTFCLGTNRDNVYLYQVPDNGILKRCQGDDGLYCFLDDSLIAFSLYSVDEWNLVNQEIREGTVVFDNPEGLKRYKPQYMEVSFGADYLEMAISMGHYTDNLATHDCLCHVMLSPIWLYELKKERNCRHLFRCIKDNISTIWDVSKGHRVDSLNRMTYANTTGYEYLYYDKELGLNTLFEELPEEEASWNLYYYPTLCYNGPDLEKLETVVVFDDETGTLLRFEVPYRPPYVHYYRIDGSRYCRIALPQRDLPLEDGRYLDKNEYLLLTKRANKLIQSFYMKLSTL